MPALPAERQTPPSSRCFTRDPRDPDLAHEHLRLPALPNVISTARRFAVARLRAWHLAPFAEDVELVTSELVTNAVRAVGPADGPGGRPALLAAAEPTIVLQLRRTSRRLFCEAWDPSTTAPRHVEPGALDEGGRGMLMVAMLASGWGSYPSVVGGKVVSAWWELT